MDRNTKWRQGSVLRNEDAHQLKLIKAIDSDERVVVISHDCDLRHPKEEFVEVIVGTIIKVKKPNSNYIGAKNVRCLHIKFSMGVEEQYIYIELLVSKKQVLNVEIFNDLDPESNFSLSVEEKRILGQWLSARYGRPAFPDTFENRLRDKKIIEPMGKILEKSAHEKIVGLFFDLGQARHVELLEGEPYVLSIFVVYDGMRGGEPARVVADQLALALANLFHSVCGLPDVAEEIALEKCAAVSETYFTLEDIRKTDQWRVEYISLQKNSAEPCALNMDMPV